MKPKAVCFSPVVVCLALLVTGCYNMRPSTGGAQTSFRPPRQIEPADIAVPAGYRVELVAAGFTYPTGVCFDANGTPHVVEAGYSYGEDFTKARLIRVERDGSLHIVTARRGNGPWTGVDYANGAFFVAEGGELKGGRILRISPGGQTSVLVSDLPSMGDHHTNGPAIGPDGSVYFGVGTATNSGVVGEDNANFGWLRRQPRFHDIPAKDIVLTGQNFETRNALTGRGTVVTGAFLPYGTPSDPGQVIRGQTKSSGAILRVSQSGGEPQLVAWGFRNPFGLRFSPNGQLYVTENGFDDRGSRPVWGTGDYFWRVKQGTWYGWPDYAGGLPLTKPAFKPPGKPQPQFLLARHPNVPPRPVATLGVHASANSFDFSGRNFGHSGNAFIPLFGDQAPGTGKVTSPVGFKVVRVNPTNGAIEDFAVNKGRKTGPASLVGGGGLERPIAARFDPTGRSLYVVDFGVLMMRGDDAKPVRNTGVLWRITRE